MTPPQRQRVIELVARADTPFTRLNGWSQVQGCSTAGTHGLGTRAPAAAAVASATAGLSGQAQAPKGGMFWNGKKSRTVSIPEWPPPRSSDGELPNWQRQRLPAWACVDIRLCSRREPVRVRG